MNYSSGKTSTKYLITINHCKLESSQTSVTASTKYKTFFSACKRETLCVQVTFLGGSQSVYVCVCVFCAYISTLDSFAHDDTWKHEIETCILVNRPPLYISVKSVWFLNASISRPRCAHRIYNLAYSFRFGVGGTFPVTRVLLSLIFVRWLVSVWQHPDQKFPDAKSIRCRNFLCAETENTRENSVINELY